MSDFGDDDYEFDEFHDMLFDADPSPDLADDLADRATYSPVWHDNPTDELREYFSDWDYYSDDYFDDDPALLSGDSKGVDARKGRQRQPQQNPKRGRKRKLSEAREMPELKKSELDALTASLRGTVWKGQSPEPGEMFKAGAEQPVALRLSDEVMQAAYNKKQGFGKGKRRQDESWANDLSLADMGLKTERSVSMHDRSGMDDQGDDEGDYEQADEEAIEDGNMADEEAVEAETMIAEQYRVELQTEAAPIDNQTIQAEIDGHGPRKRRKVSSSATNKDHRAALPTPDASLESEAESGRGTIDEHIMDEGGRSGRGQPSLKTDKRGHVGDGVQETASKGRKRKMSVSESSATGSTASSRAKRAATAKETDSKPTVKTAAASRPSRSRRNKVD